MEGMRDVALAVYENLPNQEKAKIHNDFKQMIANGSSTVSNFIEFFPQFKPKIVVKFLQNCGYEEGRLDFNDFITLKYVLENHSAVICNRCSSVILGRPYFSCYECFSDFSEDSYDLCIGCYRSKKFEDHDHKQFYDNQKLLSLCRSVVAGKEMKEEPKKSNNRINRAAIEFAGKFLDFARSITSDGLENYLDRVLKFDKNKKLGRDSKEPEETDKEVISALARLKEVRPRIDFLGVTPTPQNPTPCVTNPIRIY